MPPRFARQDAGNQRLADAVQVGQPALAHFAGGKCRPEFPHGLFCQLRCGMFFTPEIGHGVSLNWLFL
ncbi:hypothetical protein, partial [Arthrobacter sp. MAHUQ-56]